VSTLPAASAMLLRRVVQRARPGRARQLRHTSIPASPTVKAATLSATHQLVGAPGVLAWVMFAGSGIGGRT